MTDERWRSHPAKPDWPCPECGRSDVMWVDYRPDPRPIGLWPWHLCRACGYEAAGRVIPWCDACETWHAEGVCPSTTWTIVDGRTGERVGTAAYLTERRAWEAIAGWFDRHARGIRPDISRDFLENMTVQRKER